MTENIQQDEEERPKDVLQRIIDSKDPETGESLGIDQAIAESIIQL
jgi:hypothetical protein